VTLAGRRDGWRVDLRMIAEGNSGEILSGIKVLDLSRDLSGPYTSMILAELGAHVIKLEYPGTGDESRSWPPRLADIGGYFGTVNRSKRSIAVDLKQREGIDIVLDMARDSDVFMQSFAPGTASRLGIGYSDICAVNEGIIYYSLSGFGQDGPWRTRRGYDPILQAISGHMSIMGEEHRGPVKSMAPIADVSAAVHGVAAILGGLFWHARTGKGQHIDMSMLDVMVSMLSVVATRYLLTGEVPVRKGTENPQRVPSAAFECADGRRLQVVPNQRQWPSFCKILGHPEWAADAHFATPTSRVEHADRLYGLVREAFRAQSADHWEAVLTEANIACAPINSLNDVFDSEQVKHRQLVDSFELEGADPIPALRLPFRYSQTPSFIHMRPPRVGEHTIEILQEIGRSKEEISRLVEHGVVSAPRVNATGRS
jgi:crotonobetainyl-CoA:carnitine CoA-transferase CaiB-like acyl-CoA transferase